MYFRQQFRKLVQKELRSVRCNDGNQKFTHVNFLQLEIFRNQIKNLTSRISWRYWDNINEGKFGKNYKYGIKATINFPSENETKSKNPYGHGLNEWIKGNTQAMNCRSWKRIRNYCKGSVTVYVKVNELNLFVQINFLSVSRWIWWMCAVFYNELRGVNWSAIRASSLSLMDLLLMNIRVSFLVPWTHRDEGSAVTFFLKKKKQNKRYKQISLISSVHEHENWRIERFHWLFFDSNKQKVDSWRGEVVWNEYLLYIQLTDKAKFGKSVIWLIS